jgi:uncharacterized protein
LLWWVSFGGVSLTRSPLSTPGAVSGPFPYRPRDNVSASLRNQLQEALNQARRDRDRLRVSVLSTTLSEVRNREIELGREATDEDIQAVLARAQKQRRETAEQMMSGGRPELGEKETQEAAILAEFLPEPLEESEVRARVRESIQEGVTEMGPLMGRLMPLIRGRFDGKEANRIVREELARDG